MDRLIAIGLIEFISTFFLISLIYQNTTTLGPLIVGFGLVALLTFGGTTHIPHMNPALSVVFAHDGTKEVSFQDLFVYIPTQILGAIVAYYYVTNVKVIKK